MKSLYLSEDRITRLKERANRCVCRFCGSPLKLRRILFNDIDEARVEIFCEHCDAIEYGVEPEIYACARDFVDNLEFNCYEGLDQNEKTHRMNIAKVCDILQWSLKNMALLDKSGFTVPVRQPDISWAECVSMRGDDIDETKEFGVHTEDLS